MANVGKTQTDRSRFVSHDYYYEAARNAMHNFLAQAAYALASDERLHVLLPAYIGVSPKEGSGIYDPIVALTEQGLIDAAFYRMTGDLRVDVVDACNLIQELKGAPFVFLKVNYFGFSDPAEALLFQATKAAGGLLLEDNAHGFFTFEARRSHFCDACFFSLHKQFPFEHGGMLHILNDELAAWPFEGSREPRPGENPWAYDRQAIAEACRGNFEIVEGLALERLDLWTPLRTLRNIEPTAPQTYPLVLRDADRFQVYLDLNELGFGVTSLYHTLIEPLRGPERFAPSQALAARILNVPVHQDVDPLVYPELMGALAEACEKNRL